MAKYYKKGLPPVESEAANLKVQETVREILADVRQRGDAAVRELSERFDGWSPPDFRLSPGEIDSLVASVSRQTIEDIKFAQAQIRNFAEHQRAALKDVEVETIPGVRLGHRNIPVRTAGCYTPAGRYPMVASAHMTIVTAKVAGVERVIACTPPTKGKPHPETIAAMALAGADEIYLLGGVQAVAAMALGTETIAPVDMLVGPGNAYVAEAEEHSGEFHCPNFSRNPDDGFVPRGPRVPKLGDEQDSPRPDRADGGNRGSYRVPCITSRFSRHWYEPGDRRRLDSTVRRIPLLAEEGWRVAPGWSARLNSFATL